MEQGRLANSLLSCYLLPKGGDLINLTRMTANGKTRPVKYAQLEWRNEAGERFDQFSEGCLAYLKEEEAPFTGCAVENTDGGKPSLEGNFHEGRLHGEEIWYFDNGSKNSLVTFNHGVRHGPHLVWYESGELQIDVCYSNGRRDGRHSVFYEGGQKRSQADFVNDKLHGSYTTWHEDGSKKTERVFEDGEENLRREWGRDGAQKEVKNWNQDGTSRRQHE